MNLIKIIKFSHKINFAKAFTLAEVLITLGIIGIVAAMTIPTLLNEINKSQYEVALKSLYSDLTEATKRLAYENGNTFAGLAGGASDYPNIFQQSMRGVHRCDTNISTTGCWHKPNEWYTFGGSPVTSGETFASGLVLSSGALLNFYHMSTDCTSNTELSANIGCTRIRVDVNGFKGPNKVARDIFDFYILKDRLIPRGSELTSTSGTDCPTSSTYSCAQRVLTVGMDY